MAELDRRTIQEFGLDGQVLMETAGRSLAGWLCRRLANNARVAFLCGPGNNGGDGLVAARAWADRGGVSDVFLAARPDRYTGDAERNLRRAEAWGLRLRPWEECPRDWGDYGFIVDALFGTGLTRKLDHPLLNVIDGLPVERTLAADIPSGVHGDTGQILGGAVRAVATLTFGLPKLGLLLHPGAGHVGALEVVPIGFPPRLLQDETWPGTWITPQVAREWLPQRGADSHKGTSGRTLIVAGSRRYPGAACLATLGALRGGAGLVYVYAPSSVLETVLAIAPEAIPIQAAGDEHCSQTDLGPLQKLLQSMNSWCIGPGLGNYEETLTLVSRLLRETSTPVVVDADALRALPPKVGVHALLTPHHGELSRMVHTSVSDIERDRLGVAVRAARNYGSTVLLKGVPTLVATGSGNYVLASSGTPVLAQGGSGDVLTGLATALLAQGLPVLEAGGLAAYLHGVAGELGGVPVGLGARAVAELIPRAWARASAP
jgi:ADP-dependent NAD(P)H-hydrate dehydratase / NAD(P)H-hydrate epimerase